MELDQLRSAYREFFMKSESGKEFMRQLLIIIDMQHANAEADPELSRDYVQRARGVRDVKSYIDSLVTVKKGEQS